MKVLHMNKSRIFRLLHALPICICIVFALASNAQAVKSIVTPQGVYGHPDTPKLPWCSYIKHDPNRPIPPFVETGTADISIAPPSDAMVLFDGKDISQWHKNNWKLSNGAIISARGSLTTRVSFGDCQLHLEFMAPKKPSPVFSDRGNNGVLLMGLYEIQIFDSHPSHKKQIYSDGQCAAIYGETPPLINACRLPGMWQSFDIIFTAPVFKDGKLLKPASVTMLHNGVLVHLNTTIHGPMNWRAISNYKTHAEKLPLTLMGHNSPVQFRNIWIRTLNNKEN
jgi:hypothetical protein